MVEGGAVDERAVCRVCVDRGWRAEMERALVESTIGIPDTSRSKSNEGDSEQVLPLRSRRDNREMPHCCGGGGGGVWFQERAMVLCARKERG